MNKARRSLDLAIMPLLAPAELFGIGVLTVAGGGNWYPGASIYLK